MASPSERTRNNVRAGIFVSLAIAAGVVAIIFFTNAWRSIAVPTREYQVTFNVSEGVKNLKKGADVRIGGVTLGQVKTVLPRFGEPFEKIDVTFAIDENVELYKDARVMVTPALIGADAWLEVSSVGSTDLPLAPGDMLEGYSGPGIMTVLLGAENAEKADQMVENLRVTTGEVRSLTTRINQEDWPRWSDRIDHVMTWASGATTKIDAVLDEGYAFIADTHDIVEVNRPKIDTTMDNVVVASDNIAEVTARVRTETVDKVHALLDKGQEGVDSAASVLDKLDKEFDIWTPEVRDALAGARQTAQQLKLASIEVRRSPWKLLYRPKQSELEHELLYEAARSFALAVSDLKAAAASTERLVANHSDDISDDPEAQERIREFLESSINRYQDAQQRLIDVLLAE